jgi:hypothetical protein
MGVIRGELDSAVKDARHVPQEVTWLRADGEAQDLTGATLSGRLWPIDKPAEARDIDGVLTVTDEANGVFRWE